MSRIAALCALCVLLAGCGAQTERTASVKPTRTPDRAASDRAAIQKRVAAYMRHMLAGEGRQACAQFTPALRGSLDRRAAEGGLGDCVKVLSEFGETVAIGMPEGFAEEGDQARPRDRPAAGQHRPGVGDDTWWRAQRQAHLAAPCRARNG